MTWLCLTLLLIRITVPGLQDFSLYTWTPLHHACVEWSQSYHLAPVFAGLVCGASLPPQDQRLFLNLGIYHWLVASGGHLVFLQNILQKVIKNKPTLLAVLFGYTLICNFQPPIARSLVGLALSLLSERVSLFMTRSQLITSTGALTLFLFPDWWTSFSFQLSWLAALALSVQKTLLRQALMISIVLFPLSQTWSLLHLIYNFLLTPLFAVFLFPMSVIFFILAPVTSLGNLIWDGFFTLAHYLPQDANPLLFDSSNTVIWCYILSLQTLHFIYEMCFSGLEKVDA